MTTLVDLFEIQPPPQPHRPPQLTIYDLAVEWEDPSSNNKDRHSRSGHRVWQSED